MNNLPSRSEGKVTSCKNCGHEEKYHKATQYYKENDCHFFINEENLLDYERCFCEQFVPSEDNCDWSATERENNNLYPKGHEKVTRGCGKEVFFKMKIYKCGKEGYLCPSCSNLSLSYHKDSKLNSSSPNSPTNLPSRRVNLGNREVAKDKDPNSALNIRTSKKSDLGSDIQPKGCKPLSDRIFIAKHFPNREVIDKKDVAEAVRKLKEDEVKESFDIFDVLTELRNGSITRETSERWIINKFNEKIDKIFGEFK